MACVRESLPYAWTVISQVAADLAGSPEEFADHAVPLPSEVSAATAAGAGLASDAIRGGLERHFGVRLAFQNCHRVAAFRPGAVSAGLARVRLSLSSPPRPAAQPVAAAA